MTKEKFREVYAEKCDSILAMNPYVDMPRLRVSEYNKLSDLVRRNIKMAIVQSNVAGYLAYECPNCGKIVPSKINDYHFCMRCGQKLDTENYAL